jgi:hypothetical protein
MRREGRPECAPAPHEIPLSATDLHAAKEWATTQAMARKYSDRRDSWGQGLRPPRVVRNVGRVEQDELPTLVGKLGEVAFAYFINAAARRLILRVDFKEQRRGDGGLDFVLLGFRIDVKTRSTESPSLVRKADASGRIKPLMSHRYVFAHLDREMTRVLLLGWADREAIMRCPSRPARFGHVNYEVPDERLEPMNSLAILARGGD